MTPPPLAPLSCLLDILAALAVLAVVAHALAGWAVMTPQERRAARADGLPGLCRAVGRGLCLTGRHPGASTAPQERADRPRPARRVR